MRGIFIHHPLFRILFPPLYGTLVYVLVLMAFDSIQQLEENFFSQEVLLCIGLTYALSESLRLVLMGINRLFPVFKSIQRRIFIYLTANLLCSLLIISAGVTAYFIWVVGYSSFTIELITLNSIYWATTVLYTLVYFGIYYLNHYNQRRLEQETALREKMEYQLATLQRDINPALLYSSLETLINLAHTNPDEADNFIACLSKIYRYSLENRRQELVEVTRELEAAQNIAQLLNYTYAGRLQLAIQTEELKPESQLVPGTLQKLIEHAVHRSLITERQPLHLHVKLTDEWMQLRYDLHERLLQSDTYANTLPDLKQAYSYFTQKPLVYFEEEAKVTIRIPFLTVAVSTTQLA